MQESKTFEVRLYYYMGQVSATGKIIEKISATGK